MRALRFFLFVVFCAGALLLAMYKIRSPQLISADLGSASQKEQPMKVYDIAEKLPWLNVSRPLTADDLLGKVVLLDFWTYCCINCMHILPDLKKLEREFGDKLVVIGVHSAKFQNEKESENIRDAIVRYGIEHPVINDADFVLWRAFDIHSWPSFVLLDSKGMYRGSASGEGQYEVLKQSIQKLIVKSLGNKPLPLKLETQRSSTLSFPGKLAYDSAAKKFFVSDSNHNRLIRFDKSGAVDLVVGSGNSGQKDGDFEHAEFHQPQGIVVDGDYIYVADTSNHLIRRVDLKSRKVETLMGTGHQGYNRNPSGGDLRNIPLASPWDVEIFNYRGKKLLAIAMAGTHQIWALDLKSKQIELLAGSGREDIDDGFARAASLAQTSGLFAVGEKLYFADSETSSIRVYEDGQVRTLIGAGLFEFGLKDGEAKSARLQHALGLAVSGDHLYIADTYNHAIRELNLKTNQVSTLISKELKEPNDVLVADEHLFIADTNNNKVRVFDFKSKTLKEIPIQLNAAVSSTKQKESPLISELPFLPNLKILSLQSGGSKKSGEFHAKIEVRLPKDHKINEQAPSSFELYSKTANGFVKLDSGRVSSPNFEIGAKIEKNHKDLTLDLTIYYCPKTESAMSSCTISSVRVPMKVSSEALNIKISL